MSNVLFQISPTPPRPWIQSWDDWVLAKMLRNTEKAVRDHFPQITVDEARPMLPTFKALSEGQKGSPLCVTKSSFAHQGKREAMEDFHFIKQEGDYVLAGVFDGHSGQAPARRAKEYFETRFCPDLVDIKKDFEKALEIIEQEIEENGEGGAGTTACLCLVDIKTGRVYGATLGDSEAKIYRDQEEDPPP